ncbi:MAG: pseudouridine-5-phosphate glycosidase [Rhodobacteraceae bacterium]|nr:pseudouridine-5-phosphate glycosidase [Paracoccaceae bacterium]
MNKYTIHPEVLDELRNQRPVVALESTIITHGMPYPHNLDIAKAVEDEVRVHGATPATIAVLDGNLHIGLTPQQLKKLAVTEAAMKLSRADIAIAMAKGETGGTTVAGTMIAAALVGISVFATGGIGGVHRGAELSFDVSADLNELAQTPITVVAAGAKAILDLPKTLEVLETLGVPVIAYGQDELPAFWSRSSGLKAPLRLDSAKEIALAHKTRTALGLSGGQLVANPIPIEHQITRNELEPLIDAAIKRAKVQGINKKDVTPFLLKTVLELSKGKSLSANKALILNNARLASKISQFL